MLKYQGRIVPAFRPFLYTKLTSNQFFHRQHVAEDAKMKALKQRGWHQNCTNAEASVDNLVEQEKDSPIASIPQSLEWELDFCSRPLLDERNKKIWELLITDPEGGFQFAEYFPNNKVNSAELKKSIEQLLEQEGAVQPRKVRYFRGQMRTIITRALEDLNITVVPSRRCYTLASTYLISITHKSYNELSILEWLNDRTSNVYPKDPRYTSTAQPLFTLDSGAPEDLPDNLRGEAWDFVQLPLSVLLKETEDIEKGEIFGATLDLSLAGLDTLPLDAQIPGVSVYSRRAEPLAAWMSGLEISRLSADIERSCLLLDTGVNETWRYGGYKPSEEAHSQARFWEKAKERSKGLHFLTIQDDPEAEYCLGLWLMVEIKMLE